MNVKSKAGFSLVELMVVVAIIGILATVAIPNFTKFQAKAKQSSAKSELTGIFTAEKGFHAEYQSYHPNLPHVGYVPEGATVAATGCPNGFANQRNYVVGFGENNAAAAAGPVAWAAVILGSSAPRCGAASAASIVNEHVFNSTVAGGPVLANMASDSAVQLIGANTFTAEALGRISNTNNADGNWDSWTMTQDKVLTNRRSGI